MLLNMFENYFDRVTKGVYRQHYTSIGKNFRDADGMFARKYNVGICGRPDLYEKYTKMLMDAMRVDGAPNDVRREVSKRLREFFRINFNVK